MDTRFLIHNTHLDGAKAFQERDPQLRRLKQQKFVHIPSLLHKLPTTIPGIYSLGGGRQIGKTTLLKQWMFYLLKKGVSPQNIAFFSGELIDDHHSLLQLLQHQLSEMPSRKLCFILIDEITYIKEWDKTIKYAADSGLLDNVVLLLTGSDLGLMQEARMRFPGRRGKASETNFHLYPLSFKEFVTLVSSDKFLSSLEHDPSVNKNTSALFELFQQYLIHGGYLTAINDYASHQIILPATLTTYADWIRGDMLKRGKQEHYLREILMGIIKRYTSQITWNNLASDLSIDHPATVADYCAQLEIIDALFIQSALVEDKLTAAPKKARKLMFTDPFIFHAIRTWLWPTQHPFKEQINPAMNDPILASLLAEACAATHYRRYYPTYYIKGETEVDIAYIKNDRFWPIEIKWTNQIHRKDLKQIMKYPNGRIYTKQYYAGKIENIPTEPLPIALWKL
jgi:uncharacterized protein